MTNVSTLLASMSGGAGMTYAAQLRSKEWEKRRSKYLTDHGSWCRSCKQSNKQIQVHHINYDHAKLLWEHEDVDMVALCSGCHKRIHGAIKTIRSALGSIPANDAELIAESIRIAVRLFGSDRLVNHLQSMRK